MGGVHEEHNSILNLAIDPLVVIEVRYISSSTHTQVCVCSNCLYKGKKMWSDTLFKISNYGPLMR